MADVLQISQILARAVWVKPEKKRILKNALSSFYVRSLLPHDQEKLARVLCSLLYAEKLLKAEGKKLSFVLERFLTHLGCQRLFCATLGMWNIHSAHAKQFGYSKRSFKKLLEDDTKATDFVIRYLVEELKLNKSVPFIFAEYNHNDLCTSVVALQRVLNQLATHEDKKIQEDGLIGPETRKAISLNLSLFPKDFSLDHLNEAMILKTLDHFANIHGIKVDPFIPQHVIRRDMRFLFTALIKSFKNFSTIKRLKALFERHIDVPTYVSWAMEAYAELLIS